MKFALPGRAANQKVVVSAVFVAAMFMNIMDGTVVNVALPTLSRYFGAPIGSVSGVVTAYLVALAVAMPASGWVGDRFGGRNVLVGSIGLFTAASALCGVATSLPELVAFRALQGLGGGMLVPVGMTMITRVFPPAERIKANQILVVPTLLAPALGPVIGGALVDGLSWRWIFYINLPIGLAAVAVGALFLPGGSEHPAGRFDLPGMLLAATGFPLFLYAISVGSSSGWSSPLVVGTGLSGLALLAAFVAVEQRVASPLLRLRIYRDRLFRITSLQLIAASGGFMGTLFLVPLLLQNGLGFSAIHSGLSTFTEALGGMCGTQLTSRIYKRVGPRRLMITGMSGTRADDRRDGAGRTVGRGLADPAADVLHRALVRVRDGALAGRQHGQDLRRRDRARVHPAEHGPAGRRGGRGRAARHHSRRHRGQRARPGRVPRGVPGGGVGDGARGGLLLLRQRPRRRRHHGRRPARRRGRGELASRSRLTGCLSV